MPFNSLLEFRNKVPTLSGSWGLSSTPDSQKLKNAESFFFLLFFLDSGNLLAFGYRLPEKSYAIFRLPPPANSARSAKEQGPSKTRVSNNLNRARKMASFDPLYRRDKKEISSNTFDKHSETLIYQAKPEPNQIFFNESDIPDSLSQDYTKLKEVEMTTASPTPTSQTVFLSNAQAHTETISTSIKSDPIFQPTPLTVQTTELTKTPTLNINFNPKNNSIFEIFPTSENENFLTSSEMISDFGDVTIEKEILSKMEVQAETISNEFSNYNVENGSAMEPGNEIVPTQNNEISQEHIENNLRTKIDESIFSTVSKVEFQSNFTEYDYDETKDTFIDLTKTSNSSTVQNTDIWSDSNSKFETDDSVFPTFQTEFNEHLNIETELEDDEDSSEVIQLRIRNI